MTTPFKWGAEFVVNTTVANSQLQPTITALADGRFVVAWTDGSQSGGDTSGAAIRAQVFNADGSLSGGEFLVNTRVTNSQIEQAITALADGRFVVAWQDLSSGTDYDIRSQVFNADGSTSGTEFLVNTTVTGSQFEPTITALTDGRFVVGWTDLSQSSGDSSVSAVRAQVFNADGSAFGNEFQVNTTVTNSQFEPNITALADGRFVVAWTDLSQSGGDTSGYAVRAQVFNADGSAFGNEFLVNTTVTNSQFEPTITSLVDGRFVVAWSDDSATGGDTLGGAVRAQVFNADGSLSGAEFLVNTTVTNFQFDPKITALYDGRFVVSWRDLSQTGGDTSGFAIRAQAFNADGSFSGAEFLVNTTVTGNQYQQTITALADGRFVVAWQDSSNAADPDIRAQIFDPREAAITLNGTLAGDDFVGTIFADQIAGFYGDDTLVGAAGDDRLNGEFGNDVLRGGNGNDRAYGDDGDDAVSGGGGADGLYGGAGNDTLTGGSGADAMAGGLGNDLYLVDSTADLVIEALGEGMDEVRADSLTIDLQLYVNVENATLLGSGGSDINGSAAGNFLVGNSAGNLIDGGAGNDTITGGAGTDVLIGNTGSDNLIGGTGNDTIYGGAGSDNLLGGTGKDELRGDQGGDSFVFNSAAEAGNGVNRDRITDFQAGVDQIHLFAFMAGGAFIGSGPFVVGGGPQVRFVPASGLVLGDVTGDGVVDFSIRLDGAPVITAADFLF